MVLPIVLYGAGILQQAAAPVPPDFQGLSALIADMWDTLYQAKGAGLAAPQVNVPLQLFLVDSTGTYAQLTAEERAQYFEGDTGIRQVFINAAIIQQSGDSWCDEEGCLSIPGITAPVQRPWRITLRYEDENRQPHTRSFSGITARMIQHEYDHTMGVLYLHYLPPLTRQLLKSKLKQIAAGRVKAPYRMRHIPRR